jgi:hypothetical protein
VNAPAAVAAPPPPAPAQQAQLFRFGGGTRFSGEADLATKPVPSSLGGAANAAETDEAAT